VRNCSGLSCRNSRLKVSWLGTPLANCKKPSKKAVSPWRIPPCQPHPGRRTEPQRAQSSEAHENHADRHCRVADLPGLPSSQQTLLLYPHGASCLPAGAESILAAADKPEISRTQFQMRFPCTPPDVVKTFSSVSSINHDQPPSKSANPRRRVRCADSEPHPCHDYLPTPDTAAPMSAPTGQNAQKWDKQLLTVLVSSNHRSTTPTHDKPKPNVG